MSLTFGVQECEHACAKIRSRTVPVPVAGTNVFVFSKCPTASPSDDHMNGAPVRLLTRSVALITRYASCV